MKRNLTPSLFSEERPESHLTLLNPTATFLSKNLKQERLPISILILNFLIDFLLFNGLNTLFQSLPLYYISRDNSEISDLYPLIRLKIAK